MAQSMCHRGGGGHLKFLVFAIETVREDPNVLESKHKCKQVIESANISTGKGEHEMKMKPNGKCC